MKKFLIAIIFLVVISMIGFSLFVKGSYEPLLTLAEINDNKVRVSYEYAEFDEYFYYDQNMTYEELKNNSDIVIEVKCLDEGMQKAYSTLRKCEVIKVISGNCSDDNIYIYEPSYMLPYEQVAIINGYINMKKNNNYILFLKKVNAPNNVSEEYSKAYYPTSAMFGKYKVNHFEKIVMYEAENDIYYSEIKDHCTMLIDSNDVDKYNKIVEKINHNYIK